MLIDRIVGSKFHSLVSSRFVLHSSNLGRLQWSRRCCNLRLDRLLVVVIRQCLCSMSECSRRSLSGNLILQSRWSLGFLVFDLGIRYLVSPTKKSPSRLDKEAHTWFLHQCLGLCRSNFGRNCPIVLDRLMGIKRVCP